MFKKIALSTVITSAAILSAQAQADVSATVSLVSDYVYNGVSNTDNDPTLQGSVDWYNDAGFYAGVWASGLDEGFYSSAEVEIDYYAGYAGSINDDFGYDLGYAFYTYPGANDAGAELNYGELYGSVTYKESTTAKVQLSDNYSGEIGNSVVVSLSHTISLPEDFSLTLDAAHTKLLDDKAAAYYGSDAGDDSYTNWGISVAKSVAGFDLSLGYTDNNIEDNYWGDITDARAVLSISRTFE
ncbi:TorF family putative porin [uncultured Amphritea sp.]|uniref:TorF family putative porin n=1 Tax=uncultured Amphritea sp. TaxID=981605 RepID=UPI002621FD89|nr:TorF family putative porin [uncultured Amphritea sp.]